MEFFFYKFPASILFIAQSKNDHIISCCVMCNIKASLQCTAYNIHFMFIRSFEHESSSNLCMAAYIRDECTMIMLLMMMLLRRLRWWWRWLHWRQKYVLFLSVLQNYTYIITTAKLTKQHTHDWEYIFCCSTEYDSYYYYYSTRTSSLHLSTCLLVAARLFSLSSSSSRGRSIEFN